MSSVGSSVRSGMSMVLRSWLGAAALLALVPDGSVYGQTTFTVNSPADQVDAAPGNGVCDAGGGQCTIRAAVQEANALAGDDTIVFDPALNGTPITLTIPLVDACPPDNCFNEAEDAVGDLDVFDNLTIVGNGAGNTILQGGADPASSVDRVLEIFGPCSFEGCVTASISGVTIRYGGRGADQAGGVGISVGNAITTITDSVIADNVGSGIWMNFAGRLLLDRVTFARNRGKRGGGLRVRGSSSSIAVSNTTFHDNTADEVPDGGQGGALYIDTEVGAEGTSTIVNSTFSGNRAVEGCAIFNADGLLLLHDVTVANNCAPGSGAAALVASADGEGVGTTALRNSVVVSPGPNCQTIATTFSTGSFTSEGHNVSSDASCGLAAAGDVQGTEPLLGPLANNGGPTQTHLLLPGSPAIDTGTPLQCPATDQRGLARPVDGNTDGVTRCDRGAVEVAASAPPPTSGTIQGTAWEDVVIDDGLRQLTEPAYPGLPICVFPSSPTLCMTTLPDGTYQFTNLAPGIYHVYEKLPANRMNTTPRSRQVDVVAGGIVAGVDFGSRVPPPSPPGWVAPTIEVQKLKLGGYFPVRAVPPCAATTVTATVVYAGLTVTQVMTNVGSNSWETWFLSPGGTGVMPVTIVANCAPEPFHGFIIFIDPSGTIFDGCTGQPMAGATVRLLKNDAYGSASYVVPDLAEHLPNLNPQITTADGLYAWDVVPGRWRIEASKPGYDTVITDPFEVPPPKLGLDITLTATAGCNVPPVANDDAYATNQGTPLSVAAPGVLANDTDAHGNALTAVLVTNGASGNVTLNSEGSFTYTPNAGFHGADTFTYKANDGADDSNVSTVTIAVRKVNRPPVARDDAYRTKKNRAFFIAAPGVLANDADPEGSALTASLVRRPAHGILLLNPSGWFVYLPKRGFVGTDTFTYKASDGVNTSNTATVTITVARKTKHDRDEDNDDDDDREDHDRGHHDHDDGGRHHWRRQ